MKMLSQDQPCDFTGISGYRMIDECGGVQWPCRNADVELRGWVPGAERSDVPESCKSGASQAQPPATHALSSSPSAFTERRLFADGRFFHPDAKARFVYAEPGKMPEPPCEEYPLLLLTGRGTASQWHTQTRTSKSAVLRKLYPSQIYVEIHPSDARHLNIAPLEKVKVASRRGELIATAFITPTIQPGHVFIPMHYEATNRLTLAHFDPYSRQPSYKDCAVQIRPCES